MKHYILVNPMSGNKKGVKHGIIVQKLLKKYDIDAKIIISEYPKHLTKIARKLSSQNDCRIYSIGGDGTLNEIIEGIIGTKSEIVVIPCGTGNDFIKNISNFKSVRKIIKNSINSKAILTDVLRVNKNQYCINILNAGFDAMVAKNVDYFRIVPFISGKAKYNLAIFYTLLMNKNYKFKLRILTDDGNQIIKKDSYTLIAVSNGKYYGGGISPSPDADISDGILDVCALDSTSVKDKIILLPKYKQGKHVDLNKANLYKAKKIHIVSTKKFPVSNDGEVFYTNKLSIEVLKKSIYIVRT